eukprot:jgi/Mesvir1/363/Mv18350-RA.2
MHGVTGTPRSRMDFKMFKIGEDNEPDPVDDISFFSDMPLLTSRHTSLMAKHLTPSLYAKLKDRRTPWGFTLDMAIRAGVDSPNQAIGVTAGDAESYLAFKELFSPLIRAWHGDKSIGSFRSDLGYVRVHGLDRLKGHAMKEFVRLAHVSLVRNLTGLPLPAGATRATRREVERLVVEALYAGGLRGVYHPLASLNEEECQRLAPVLHGFGVDLTRPKPGSLLETSGSSRDWPDGRGIYFAGEKGPRLVVEVNGRDHVRFVCAVEGPDVREAFDVVARALAMLEKGLPMVGHTGGFMLRPKLGYLSSCPSDVGNATRASMQLALPLFGTTPAKLASVAARSGLLAVPTRDNKPFMQEHTATSQGARAGAEGRRPSMPDLQLWELSHKATLGCLEGEAMTLLVTGALRLIEIEKRIKKNRPYDDLVPKGPPPSTTSGPSSRMSPLKSTVGTLNGRRTPPPRSPMAGDAASMAGSSPWHDSETDVESLARGGSSVAAVATHPARLLSNYPRLTPAHTSCMSRALTEGLYARLATKRSHAHSWTLDAAIQSGVDIPYLDWGILAGDADSYESFRELFDAIIELGHPGFRPGVTRVPRRPQAPGRQRVHRTGSLDPAGDYVVACTVGLSRNLEGFPLPPAATRTSRGDVLRVMRNAIAAALSTTPATNGKQGDVCGGKYYSLVSIDSSLELELMDRHILLERPDPEGEYAGGASMCARDWPRDRGQYLSEDKMFSVWLNGADHVCCVGQARGTDMQLALQRAQAGLEKLTEGLEQAGAKYLHSPRLGYLTSSPRNLGLGLSASIFVKLPFLNKVSPNT